MPEVVSGADGETDALAAEYVLGTLDADERAQAQSLLTADEAFLAKVKVWERRLGELHLMVEPVEPDGQIWERIKGKMPEARPDPGIEHPEPAADQPAATVAATEVSPPSSQPPPVAAPDATPSSSAAAGAPAPGVAAAPGPVVAAKPASAAAPVAAGVTQIPLAREAAAVLERRLGRWRALAVLMAVVVAAMAVLLGLWKYAPKLVPAALQPAELMRRMGIEWTPSPSAPPPPRRTAPDSQFDE